MGTAKAKDKKEDFLSVILGRVKDLLITDKLKDQDLINYVHTMLDSNAAHMEQMTQLMSDPAKMRQFAHNIYNVLVNRKE